MSDNIVYSQIKEKAENAEPIGGTLKFKVDEIVVFIDGSGDANSISTDDKDADCTISTTLDVLMKLKNGDINPMMAVMGGQIKISGDMGLAMKVQSLLS
ncbi:MAG: SCP2 sterol-binding domain-containing protein [Flavobacteriaceae bacterium]|nr:SCP2 sterol-binding domain-containing protein [Flavobacteriaceae bacterium]|tara:strand:+ start:333 stop:629 length:297 start_codon:yes stop_codon:yes gene_type:complete